MSETRGVAPPWQSTSGFLRVVTNPRIFKRPETINRAWRQVEEWLNCGNFGIPHAISHVFTAFSVTINEIHGPGRYDGKKLRSSAF